MNKAFSPPRNAGVGGAVIAVPAATASAALAASLLIAKGVIGSRLHG